ncbi:DUF2784 domain-containing protein [Sulfurisoma sediminicola]|uniref:Uncharacterized protein DUF2784 n=1 Tax=Sulfurisoma sediminicola TaxID=1381557 RepID=A0A497XM69_9PROT|nr:DUF2784 domain-containing protein [Sulfurisoma sediminicola]RLJ68500.1 uncharacterized protein DUF2784 [Sulfurisoma sediminicola]
MLLLLADLVVLLHLGFVIFVVSGGLLALRWPRAAWLHLPAAAWGAAVEFFGWICPLTPLENALRQTSGGGAYSGDFVSRYLLPVLYPAGLTAEIQMLLGIGVLATNATVYAWVFHHRVRQR